VNLLPNIADISSVCFSPANTLTSSSHAAATRTMFTERLYARDQVSSTELSNIPDFWYDSVPPLIKGIMLQLG